ncbi:ABC transporter permease [Thermanaerothrix daxensis]|uniref:ABC transporter permease n=1 Tax=Thermanaerothrix daxensis TaxID=869279 RepID=UPI0009FB7200|nr:ABC transporter permease [Thermanaerothrix daxensis]
MNSSSNHAPQLSEFLRRNSTYVILLAIVLGFAVLAPEFLTVNNLLTVALQSTLVALAAIGMTLAIITGGIDLSVGSVAALSGALAAGLATRGGLGTYPGLLIGLMAGAGMGLLNAVMIVWGRIPPFVATLASMAIARGLTLVYTQGRPIAGLDRAFTFWGSESLLGVPMPVWVLLVVAVLVHLLLSQTALGLHIYAIGGGEETTRLAGVNVGVVKVCVYVISGATAALSGLILTARLWSAQPNIGVGLELDAIAAAVLGGSSLAGGVGGIPGTLAGAFIIGVLSNGLNLLEVPSYNQQVIKGLVFILAVMLDYFIKQRRTVRTRRAPLAG